MAEATIPRSGKFHSRKIQMASKQNLLDSLTAHISLYNSHTPIPNPNSNHRVAILRWFSSLSVHQRRAYLTTFSPEFISIILQMKEKLQSRGFGRFIILPDLPQNDDSALPTLCYRKSEGLLLRISAFNQVEREVCEAVELFSSREGEHNDNSTLPALRLDVMSVSDGLVGDVDRFVEIMDEITNGEFLRGGEEGEMSGEWVELGWLKAKGYYSLEEFVVNRLEVALRLAWLNCNSGKKRGVKLKERLSAAGMAANLFWRKKGCVDWWEKLDGSTKKNLFSAYLGKSAKILTGDIIKRKDYMSDNKLWRSDYHPRFDSNSLGKRDVARFGGIDSIVKRDATNTQVSKDPSPLDYMFNSLYILQVISALLSAAQCGGYDKDKLFFSSLDSVNSLSDIILRKLRELLMVVSLDCTKYELLGDGKPNSLTKKLNEKPVTEKRKKKGKNRNKKSKPVPRPYNDDRQPSEPSKGSSKQDVGPSCKFDIKVSENVVREIPLSADAIEPVKGVSNGKLRTASRKSRKIRKKHKSFSSSSSEIGSCHSRITEMPSASFISQNGPTVANKTSGNSTLENVSNNFEDGIDRPKTNPIDHTNLVKGTVTHVDSDHSSKTNTHQSLKQNSAEAIRDSGENNGNDPLQCNLDNSVTTIESVVGCNDDGMCCGSYADSNRIISKRGYLGKQTTDNETERKPNMQGSLGVIRVGAFNLPANVSYEWPNIAALHPSPNTHLPTATDRLHLDVGHNWQNHFHHSFVQTLQVRNSPIENTYNGVISRHLPMSLDCPPPVRGVNRLVPSVTCSYDSEFISRRQSSLHRGFTARCTASSEDERTISTDMIDFPDVTSSQELMDEHENYWMSEDESEAHALSGMDYNQYFGNGVMYWNSSDLPGPGPSFSRPPSLCSDDSSWAWREADMSRAVDDMVAFSSSYSTNGLTSPSTASFCSPFDPLGSGPLGYVVPGSEISGKVLTEVVADEGLSGPASNISVDGEIKTVDSLPYPILRPIIIPNMSRERSRSDFKRGYDHKSPCVPPNRREHPRIKRPPSPIVLCVPHAPRPPPPSPAGDCRRHRGFSTVRSGSSSPRHWGVKGWLHDGVSFEEACLPADGSEVVWPSWRNKGLNRQLTPLVGTLLQDRLIAISQLARDQEHPDVKFPLEPPESQNSSSVSHKASLSRVHDTLHDEIGTFCKQVAAENMIRKPYISWAVKRVARSLQVLWPRSRTNVFGSNATGLSLPSSDVDLVVCLPPVRNLEPIKEAGILEGRNGIKETCLQHAARYLANQEWVKSDSLKIVENTAIPIIMLVVEVPHNLILPNAPNIPTPKEEADQVASEEGDTFQTDSASSESSSSPKWSKITNDANDGVKVVRLDISFKSPTHTGLQTTGLVKDLIERFPAITPLALVIKQFLADRSLDQSYSGGLNSYCLILLITRFLQHEHHHGRPTNQNYGSLLMDFLYFFGNVFDPRQMCISVQGSGLYLNRERGCSIDPLYIDDPLFLTNNVGRNCFRIHQCVKAFADAYTMLKNELTGLFNEDDKADVKPTCKLLPKIIPSIGHLVGGP